MDWLAIYLCGDVIVFFISAFLVGKGWISKQQAAGVTIYWPLVCLIAPIGGAFYFMYKCALCIIEFHNFISSKFTAKKITQMNPYRKPACKNCGE